MKKLARLMAYLTTAINRDLLREVDYLRAENQVWRALVKGRPKLSLEQKKTLASAARGLGQKLLAQVASIVTPDTLFRWYRELVAKKFDGSKERDSPGRPRTAAEIEALVLQMARENRSWGYRRIVGALANVGHEISHQTVADILQRNGLPTAPVRKKGTPWGEFLRTHMGVLAATDFLTVEVMSLRGLITYYVLFVIDLATRRVHVAGITHSPDEIWMKTVATQLTMVDAGFLHGKRYLIHDRDSKFTAAFRGILKAAGTKCLMLPPHSPNLNAFAERWVRSLREECLDRILFLGEGMLRTAVRAYVQHYMAERNHQGLENALIAPRDADRVGQALGRVRRRERLGGLLRFYHRVA